ncbi:MAG: hypothetical protein IPP67_04650 [Rhodospirillaceae bacterium]|nr:hypothetical protein [Rhodospirillaceae bacterium]
MELIAADKDTVTIKVNRKDEFYAILAVLGSVSEEFNKLDREIHHLTLEQVTRIEESLHEISKKLPGKKN